MSTLFVAFEDFILSREAMLCSPETIDFYRRMMNLFLEFTNGHELSNQSVREFLATSAALRLLGHSPRQGRPQPQIGSPYHFPQVPTNLQETANCSWQDLEIISNNSVLFDGAVTRASHHG